MKKWLLTGIILLGFLLRIIGLGSHPSGFTPDEASFGYDAYSILKTGKDQWGSNLPLIFKSFGDDKLPVYVYLTVPSVAVFGLNEFAVRLPNAILGTLAIVVVYFLASELFKRKDLALLSAFLLAVSPWHIMLSRGAFEANLTTFFLPLGVLLFLKSINGSNNIKYLSRRDKLCLLFSIFVFLINIFTYHTARILTPAILLFLVLNYKDKLKENKIFNLSITFSVILLVISVTGILIGGGRVASSAITDINYSDDRYLAQVVGESNVIAKFFYNKPVYMSVQFVKSYFSYFSPQFLFTNGPAEGTYGMIPGIGVVYFIEIIFLIGFLIKTVKEKNTKENSLLIFWILLSPIPAALTKGPGYAANRVAFMMPAIQIILAIGAVFIYEKLKTKIFKQYFVIGYSILLLINFVYVFEKYWVGQVVNQAGSMLYGTKQIVEQTNNFSRNIIISKNISEAQIYFAFYTKMNPISYQNSSKNWTLVNGWVDQQGQYSLGKYMIRNINYSVDSKLKNTILVGTPRDFPAEIKPDFSVNYPNLKSAYYIVLTK